MCYIYIYIYREREREIRLRASGASHGNVYNVLRGLRDFWRS